MKILCPDAVYPSILEIDVQLLKNQGIRGILVDLDNTLVRWDRNDMEDGFLEWVAQAKKKGLKLCLLSNGLSHRVTRFAKLMDIPAVGKALKPRKLAFRRGLRLLELRSSEVAMIGDQLFTDIFGGNRLGLFTILISPLSKNELRSTSFVRKIERKVLGKMVRRGWLRDDILTVRDGGKQ